MALFNLLNFRSRRGRRGRGWSRQTRLIALVAALALLVLCVVLIVRGCSNQDGTKPTSGQTAATQTPAPELTPGPDNPSEEDGEEGEIDQLSNDDGNVEDEALKDVGEEQVDLTGVDQSTQPSPRTGVRAITIRSIGDIVGHIPILRSAYDDATKEYNFLPLFADVAQSMSSADYTVLNVDGPMGGRKFANGYKGYPQFNTPPYLLNALKELGVDMLTLANNHALDTYFDGLKATVDNVESVGLDHIGAYRTQEEYDAAYVKTIGDIKVGFLNYTVGTNNMAKRSDPDASLFGLRMTSNSDASADIKKLRDAGAEVVVVYMHWGTEYLRSVNNSIRNLAKKLVAAGADVVVGGHQHVVLPCEWVTAKGEDGTELRGLVAYGIGNFLSDQRARYRDSGIIFQFTLQDNPATGKVEVVDPRYVPTYVQRVKDGDGFIYRVLACGDVIQNPPSGMDEVVLNRIKQVWNEQSEIMKGSPAEPLMR